MSNASRDEWGLVKGYVKVNSRSFIHLPEHFPLFQAFVDEMMKSKLLTEAEKQELLNSNPNSMLWMGEFPNAPNYPYEYLEVVLKAGLLPIELGMHDAQCWCPLKLWGNKKGSPITLLLEYATKADKEKFLKESLKWDKENEEAISNFLDRNLDNFRNNFELASFEERESDILRRCDKVYRYIHWSEFIDQLQGKECQADIKDQKERREWVLGLIEKGEKNVLSELKINSQGVPTEKVTPYSNYITEFYFRIKRAALR